MGLQDAAGDRQAEARPAGLSIVRGRAAVERGEQMGQVVRGDPWPRILQTLAPV